MLEPAGIFVVNCALAFFIVVMAIWFMNLFTSRRTYRYRKDLSNLYVAAKVKEYAKNDKIDLEKEVLDFKKFMKLLSLNRIKDIDDKLEEKLNKDIDVKLEKEKEKKE